MGIGYVLYVFGKPNVAKDIVIWKVPLGMPHTDGHYCPLSLTCRDSLVITDDYLFLFLYSLIVECIISIYCLCIYMLNINTCHLVECA